MSREETKQGPVPFIRVHFDAIDRTRRGLVSEQDVAAYVRSLQKRPARAAGFRRA